MAFVDVVVPTGAGMPSEERVQVNKRELAQRLKVSVPSVDALMSRYPDLPVVQKGTNGRPWIFDLLDVLSFIDTKKREERAASARRDDLLEQFTLPLLDDNAAQADTPTLTPTQRRQLAMAIREERKNAIDAGILVPVPRMQAALATTFEHLGRMLDKLPQDMGRRFGLSPDVVAAMQTAINEERRRAVAELAKNLTPEHPPTHVAGTLL